MESIRVLTATRNHIWYGRGFLRKLGESDWQRYSLFMTWIDNELTHIIISCDSLAQEIERMGGHR